MKRYVPAPGRRFPLDLESAGAISFEDLDTDSQEDVAQCVAAKLGVPIADVRPRLLGRMIPVFLADPEMLIGEEGRDVRIHDVEEYAKLLSEDIRSMPPVVVDSENLEYPLCEGGHRTVAAIDAGLPRIAVIDVALAYIDLHDGISFRPF